MCVHVCVCIHACVSIHICTCTVNFPFAMGRVRCSSQEKSAATGLWLLISWLFEFQQKKRCCVLTSPNSAQTLKLPTCLSIKLLPKDTDDPVVFCITDTDMALTDVEAPAALDVLAADGKNVGMVSHKMSGDGVLLLLLLLVVRFSRWVGETLIVRLLLFLISLGGETESAVLFALPVASTL